MVTIAGDNRKITVKVNRQELEFLKRVGGSASKGLRKLIDKGMKTKLDKDSVDLFVDDCLVVTGEPDKLSLTELFSTYEEYCTENNLHCKTKQRVRAKLQNVYNMHYGKGAANRNYFFGIQLL